MYAKWNNKEYKILNRIEINKSSREVKYTDLTLDFAKCTIEDLPFSQQEIQIFDNLDNLKFAGFLDTYKLPELRLVDKIKKELEMTLLTPRQLTTKRTVTIVKTGTLDEIIQQVLAVMYEDGFTLVECNIPHMTITVKLISRTVEEILNYLSNKCSLYWNIDEFKQITINSIEYQFNKPVKKNIDINNYKEIKGFLKITPSVENSDYANIINVKNARIFYESYKNNLNITLKKGDKLEFENPIDISIETAQRIAGAMYISGATTAITHLQIIYNDNQEASIITQITSKSTNLTATNVWRDDKGDNLFTLAMDGTFKNLATSVDYKGEEPIVINQINSQTMLRFANMKLINWHEIDKNKGKITPSGQIEKVFDAKNSWFTYQELIDYVRSIFVINDRYTNQVNLYCDKDNSFIIGDRLEINLPEIFVKGNFIITSINESKERNAPTQYNIEMRNTNLLENYIDLFRSSVDIEEQESQIEVEYVVEYAEEETIQEIHEIDFAENQNHTLNFTLNT